MFRDSRPQEQTIDKCTMRHPCYHIYGQRIHRGLPRLATFQKSLLPHQRHKDFAMIQLPIGIAKFSEERRNSGYQSN